MVVSGPLPLVPIVPLAEPQAPPVGIGLIEDLEQQLSQVLLALQDTTLTKKERKQLNKLSKSIQKKLTAAKNQELKATKLDDQAALKVQKADLKASTKAGAQSASVKVAEAQSDLGLDGLFEAAATAEDASSGFPEINPVVVGGIAVGGLALLALATPPKRRKRRK